MLGAGRRKWAVLGLVLALGAQAQSDSDDALLADMADLVQGHFDLSDADGLDAELRRDGEALVQEHLARLPALLSRWLADARAELPAGAPPAQVRALLRARVHNELALWSLDSAGPDADAVWWQGVQRPGQCRWRNDFSSFGYLMGVLDGLPPAARAKALAGERMRLARWGQPRSTVAPDPLPDVRLRAALIRARAAGGQGLPPVVPALAQMVHGQTGPHPTRPTGWRCEAFRWLLQGLSSTEGLPVFRQAMMVLPQPPQGAPPDVPGEYPVAARYFQVEGVVVVRLTLDGQNRVQEAEVVRRRLRAPGLGGQRPAAFEPLLDEASVVRARALPMGGGGGVQREVEITWRLQ